MFKLLKKPQCQKLSKFSTDRQTDRPTNLPLEAPPRRLKMDDHIENYTNWSLDKPYKT